MKKIFSNTFILLLLISSVLVGMGYTLKNRLSSIVIREHKFLKKAHFTTIQAHPVSDFDSGKQVKPDLYVQQIFSEQVCGAFFNGDEIKYILLGLIEHEQKSIKIASFRFTDGDIAEALVKAAKKNVMIQLISDFECPLLKYSKIPLLMQAGIDIRVFPVKGTQRDFRPLMHNKYMIFERNLLNTSVIVSGSYNFTYAAHRHNKENMMVSNHKKITDAFKKAFEELYHYSESYGRLKETGKTTTHHHLNWLTVIYQWIGC